jgi:hypothetical protein
VSPVIPPLFGPGPASEPPEDATADALAPNMPASATTRGVAAPPAEPAASSAIHASERHAPVSVSQPLEHDRLGDLPDERAPIRTVASPEPRQPASATALPVSSPASESPREALTPAVPRLSPAATEHGRRLDAALKGKRADDAPVVVVNIGRVEVRAVTPVLASPQPPRRVKTAVSLEEYLRPRRRDR